MKNCQSAQPESTRIISETRAIPSDDDCVSLSETVTVTYYDEENEEWSRKIVTVRDVLDSVCDEYTVLPSTQPTEASCWGCNCPKMEGLKEQKTFSEMVHLHDADKLKRCRFEYINACKTVTYPTPDTSKNDIYDANAVIKALHSIFGDEEF